MKGREAKPHIGIFGRRNNGKSALINCLSGQEVAIVSPVAGTTTDPVKKTMEIQGIGPVVMIDTAGTDDTGELGKQRVARTTGIMKQIDTGILVLAENKFGEEERRVLKQFDKWEVPYLIIHSKSDLQEPDPELVTLIENEFGKQLHSFSSLHPANRGAIIDRLREIIPESAYLAKTLVGDIISQGDLVLLITPIDEEAPEGRLILPQVQAIRDILDNDAIAVVAKEREMDTLLRKLQPRPALVITDSQVFKKVDASVPEDIPMTSFSTVLARYKGDFESYLKGTPRIADLRNGDKVLVLESCTHQVSCDDIGRVKIPRWISVFTGKSLDFKVVAGLDDIPGEITDYAMVIQCGSCMITRRQMMNRIRPAVDAGIPVSNYGMSIAYVHGIFERAVAPFTKLERGATNYL